MGQGRHTLRSVSDPVYPVGNIKKVLGHISELTTFVRQENFKQKLRQHSTS